MGQTPQITLVDKLLLGVVAARAIGAIFVRMATRPISSGAVADTYFKDVVYAALRQMLNNIGVGSEQFINGTTEKEYLGFAKTKAFDPDTTVLESGLKLHWIGKKAAKKTLLYFHGGGYVLAASAGHFQWLYDLQQELAKKQDIAIAVLGYTLAPHGQYPQQLSESAESLKYLLEQEKKDPSDIFVAGDSAGGAMVMTLASHILHPHTDVSQSIKLNRPLAGAALVSPWFQFVADERSIERHQNSDFVVKGAAERWRSLFLGSRSADEYNQVVLADAKWFKGLDKVYSDILVWGGGGEILLESIEQGTEILKAAHPSTTLVIEPGVAHEDMIFRTGLGYKNKSEGTQVIESWLAERL